MGQLVQLGSQHAIGGDVDRGGGAAGRRALICRAGVGNLTASADGQLGGAVQLTWSEAENAQVHFVVYVKLDFVQKLDTWWNRRTSCCGWPTEILHCRG